MNKNNIEDKLNVEAHVWLLTGIFKTCKDRSIKNANWAQAASGQATEDELKQFGNCVKKSLKAVALFPSVIQ